MNVTELARILKVTPQELLAKLPLLGFSVGQKAIKVDNKIAQRIIREWPRLIKELEKQQAEKSEAEKTAGPEAEEKREVKIPAFITVREFASTARLPLNKILAELMKNGIFASLNEKIDFETAWLVGSELGLEVKKAEEQAGEESSNDDKLKKIIAREDEADLESRPPVIVVMGHVDHGKTTLLDAIRKSNVAAGEAGGITQHIGAYQIEWRGRKITFIDTPGHEAFTAMRGRGAKIADIAILVVAADDGVKPQTTEAFRIIEAAKLPFIVAINKTDKPEANLDKVKQELANQLKIIPEDWGGKIACVPLSAKEKKGIDELLNIITLTADMESENIKANPRARGVGTVIESRIDKGEGPVATILAQNGTIKVGDQLCYNQQIFGKVRGLKNYLGESIETASPSVPAKVIGLKIVPRVGDILEAGEGERIKMKKGFDSAREKIRPLDDEEEKIKKINIIIKSDVLGSAEAIEESLEKINTAEVKINIIHKGLGNINEGDIARAEGAQAILIGFNVKIPPAILEMAREKNVRIESYRIIYDLINSMKAALEELIEPEIKRTELGRLKVLALFKTENHGQIVGGKIIAGRAEADSLVEVLRNEKIIERGKAAKIRSGKEEVKSAEEGQECGVRYEGRPLVEKGDILNFYREEKIKKKI